ncbi:MAG TPA: hypothetical protein PKJ63_03825 [Cyclobacteriaceae bacterium]|nr:hypothetical protein [Cyclobacteriaceae bacterium]
MKHFSRLILPGIILQSVLIGGGFATGREIVEYGGQYGASGWVSGVSIFFGFSLLAILSFEACRIWHVFDYKSLLKKLIGRGWILYELSYLMLGILIIAVMASAAGEILHNTLGLGVWVGIVLIIALVGFLNYMGESFIARMKTIGTIALFLAYTLFSFSVYSTHADSIVNVFTQWNTSYHEESRGTWLLIWIGITYVGYNLGVYPSTFFTVKNIQSRRESVIAGIIAGLLMTIPWFLTYFAIMAYYPSHDVLDATVPWLKMLETFGSSYVIIFGIVVGWTLVETATGVIHAFIGRVEVDIKLATGNHLSGLKKAMISTIALIAAMILAQVGIIDLIAKGYTFMAYAMILFYGVPLIIAAPRLLRNKAESI